MIPLFCDLQFSFVSVPEMLRLYSANGIAQFLSRCRTEETFVDQGQMHNQFCCKLYVLEYFDSQSGSQVATINRQVAAVTGKITDAIRMLKIGSNVYVLELPAI